jgi:hypothetical protein
MPMNKQKIKLLLWIFLPILIPYIFDIALTLIGQPEQYWQGNYQAVNEANPISHWFLAKHPVVYILYSIARFLGYGLFIAILPLKLSKIVSIYLILAHTIGAHGWAKNVFYVGYWERMGMLLIPAILIVYSLDRVNSLMAETVFKRFKV